MKQGFAEYPEVKSFVCDDPRTGNFTSSEIVALTANGKAKDSFGVPFYSYVEEKKMERRLGRSLSEDVFARPLSWGNLCEQFVFKLLPESYHPCSKLVLSHPAIECWKGTPDAQKFEEPKTVGEVKCPMTLKSFCMLIDAWNKGGINGIRDKHRDGEKYYWQMVSNAILTDSQFAELIAFVPYRSQLEEIRELAQNFDGTNQQRFMWIGLATDDELPFLKDGGYYKNLNIMRFHVPEEDKAFLTSRVEKAKELLAFP